RGARQGGRGGGRGGGPGPGRRLGGRRVERSGRERPRGGLREEPLDGGGLGPRRGARRAVAQVRLDGGRVRAVEQPVEVVEDQGLTVFARHGGLSLPAAGPAGKDSAVGCVEPASGRRRRTRSLGMVRRRFPAGTSTHPTVHSSELGFNTLRSLIRAVRIWVFTV